MSRSSLESPTPQVINLDIDIKNTRPELLLELARMPSIGLRNLSIIHGAFPKDHALFDNLCLEIWRASRLLSRKLGVFAIGAKLRDALDTKDFPLFCNIIQNAKTVDLNFLIQRNTSLEFHTLFYGSELDKYLVRLWNVVMSDPKSPILKKKQALLTAIKKQHWQIKGLYSTAKETSYPYYLEVESTIRESALVNTKKWQTVVSYAGSKSVESITPGKGAILPITKSMVDRDRRITEGYSKIESLVMPEKNISQSSDLPPEFFLDKIDLLKKMPSGTAIGPFTESRFGIYKQGANIFVPFYALWNVKANNYTNIHLYSGHIFFSIKEIRKLFRMLWVRRREAYLSHFAYGIFNEIFSGDPQHSFVREANILDKGTVSERNDLSSDPLTYSESKSFGFPCFLEMAQEKRMREIIQSYVERLQVDFPPVGEFFLKPKADATLCIG